MQKRVLVAGGAGFIGSHVVDALLEKGCEVTVVDNLERGRVANLKHCLSRIKFYTSDLSVPHLAFGDIDLVFDFAAKVFGAKDLYTNPATMLAKNLQTTINMLDLSVKLGVKKYVYASSSCVYDFEGCPIPHLEDVIGVPSTEYGFSKLAGERLVQAYAEEYGFKYAIARIFNVYGPRESPISPHVIPDFMRKAWLCSRGAKTFEIYGDGQQTRAFVYVADTVDGLLRIAEYLDNDVVNLGSEDAITMNNLAYKILNLFNIDVKDVKFVYVPAHPKDIKHRSGSTKKAREKIGWSPKVSLDDGLRKFKEWIVPQLETGIWR